MDERLQDHSDENLVEMAQNGNLVAFGILCSRHIDSVYNRLRALVPPEAAEDITQEVFIAAMRGLETFRGQSLFRTWLAAIVRHKAADFHRRQSRQPSTVPLEEVHGGLARGDAWEDRVMVRTALRHLPEHYQEVLLLRFAEGLPFRRVAKTLNISLEATKSRYRRAIAAFAEEMERQTDPETRP